MITVSMLLLRLQGPLIFFVIAYLIVLVQSNLLATYKCIVWPIMEYACPVWFLHTAKNINTLERVQLRTARRAAGSRWNPSLYCWSKSSDDCLKELKWPSIHQCHIYFSICQVHDILHNRNSISFSDHFHPSKVRPLNIRPASLTINSYRYSFFY